MNAARSLWVIPGVLVLVSCARDNASDPPAVRLGESVCEHCNMIISDERWATATVVDAPRGPEARLFDDFNCQVSYEVEHPDVMILARWSHTFDTREWLPTERAHFLSSPNLRTPMGSRIAAFEPGPSAEHARSGLGGDVLTFELAWTRLGAAPPGSPSENPRGDATPSATRDEQGP